MISARTELHLHKSTDLDIRILHEYILNAQTSAVLKEYQNQSIAMASLESRSCGIFPPFSLILITLVVLNTLFQISSAAENTTSDCGLTKNQGILTASL